VCRCAERGGFIPMVGWGWIAKWLRVNRGREGGGSCENVETRLEKRIMSKGHKKRSRKGNS